MLEPGMQAIVLDSDGQLLEFHARPTINLPLNSTTAQFEWNRLFAAAGLNPARFQEMQPELTPTAAFDAQAAWTGSSSEISRGSLRVEAAAYRGRPVFFRILGPWARPGQPAPLSLWVLSIPLFVGFAMVLPAVGGFLAWRNARSGRVDRRGAFRLAGFVFVFTWIQGLAIGPHTPTSNEFVLLVSVFRGAVFLASLYWVLYMAFEPQVRRRSPEALISWSRLLAGRIQDPMVGGHLLIGIALGVSSICLSQVFLTPPFQTAGLSAAISPLWSAGAFSALWFFNAIIGVGGGLGYMFVVNLLSTVVRRKWLALSIFILLSTLVLTPYSASPFFAIGRSVVLFGMVAFALTRFGILTAAAAVYAGVTIVDSPLTTNWSAWYAQIALFEIGTLIALALFGFVTTLAGRPIWPYKPDAG
jgi:hypothetical protein